MDSQKANKIITNIKTLKALMITYKLERYLIDTSDNLLVAYATQDDLSQSDAYQKLHNEVKLDLQGFKYADHTINQHKTIESFYRYCSENCGQSYLGIQSHSEFRLKYVRQYVAKLYSDVLFSYIIIRSATLSA